MPSTKRLEMYQHMFGRIILQKEVLKLEAIMSLGSGVISSQAGDR